MNLRRRLEKIEDEAHPPKPKGRVMLYDAEGQRPAPPAGAKVVILLPENGRKLNPSPTDREKP